MTQIHSSTAPWSNPALSMQFELQSKPSSSKRSRNRGAVLTEQGWQKLLQAGVLYDESGKRYTYEMLSERSLLDVRTVSRVLSCEVKVDKRTLKAFFRAFNLQLEAEDYTMPGVDASKSVNNTAPTSVQHTADLQFPIEEVIQLQQRLLHDYRRLLELLGADTHEWMKPLVNG